ncbi:DsbA family protein [Devosia sp. YIM 151766]|uniref:DsbA family protein n=1 Tax=Devosia sp. YIM 151766 TaxID=3017325 RepID=UPI00255D0381|nr:DsbA family protein [Devosia sp. YIM 151766]WIY53504.1 DsbA family protein [Devosia sp. YIM 151766]
MKFNRRETIILAAAASALSLSGLSIAQAAEGDVIDVSKLMEPAGGLIDHIEGHAEAPVTVIEYASPTCPHCASFHNSVYEPFKADYIDTGKVRFIVRPFARNALDAAIFMLAEAAGPEHYHEVISTYFRTQNDWGMSDKPRDAIFAVAQQLGFTEETFNAALTNQDTLNGIEALKNQALEEFKLTGTPTFYVNGKTLSGGKTLEQLAAEIDPLVPAGFVAPAAE